jgi:CRP-like cAMP-binding protein/CheY-like chemotaxis protein
MKKILLIEDNADIRENTGEILSLAGYEILSAENGKAGVIMAQQHNPDLIICDIMMPELDGYGVLHILSQKKETAHIPFIFLTAKTEKSDIRKGMELGADDYLTKPFDDSELLNAVASRLRKHEILFKDYQPTSEGLESFLKDAQEVLKLSDLNKDRKIKSYKKKSEIYSEGDLPLYVYFVKSGSVKSYKSNEDGKELIINLYKQNDFFGFESVLENSNYVETAVALEDSEIIVIPKHDFLILFYNQKEISGTFIGLLCKKVAEKEAQLLTLAYNSVRQRTAEALLKVFQLNGQNTKLYISREDLSKMVGTAPESVIRALSEFKDEELIEIESGKIKVTNPARLEKVVRWNVAI